MNSHGSTREIRPGSVGAMLRRFREEPFEYTMRPPRLADNAVDEFLFTTRKGFCEHYASAFTVVMRAAGIPARVVTGYQGGEFNPYGGYLLVRQSDAHAWSEVWIEGRGWLRVDPTAAVAPERIRGGLIDAVGADEPVPGRFREANPLWLQVELSWDVVNDFWNERVVRFDARSQFALLERLGVDDPDWRALGLGLAGSLAAFFVALTAYLAWRYRPPRRDWPARLHAIVVRRLRKRGLEPGPAEGPVAFLQRAEAACPDLAGDLAEIRRLYVAQRYGPRPSPRRPAAAQASCQCAAGLTPAVRRVCLSDLNRKGHPMAETTDKKFEAAARDMQKLTKRPDDEDMLRIYALYKQGTEGDVQGRPARRVRAQGPREVRRVGARERHRPGEGARAVRQARRTAQEDLRLIRR